MLLTKKDGNTMCTRNSSCYVDNIGQVLNIQIVGHTVYAIRSKAYLLSSHNKIPAVDVIIGHVVDGSNSKEICITHPVPCPIQQRNLFSLINNRCGVSRLHFSNS